MLHKNYSLKSYNTFNIDVEASIFFEYKNIDELKDFLKDNFYASFPRYILGRGSNVLFTRDFEGVILHSIEKGIHVLQEDNKNVFIEVKSGEIFDDFILWAVNNSYSGVENLSAIPGTVGACPVQNIGAYGVEVKDIIEKVFVIDVETLEEKVFSVNECEFGYRGSIFKSQFKGKYIITSVVFCLSKKFIPNISYKGINEKLSMEKKLTSKIVRDVIVAVRNSKLPDIKLMPNSGSFFKNPIVDKDCLAEIKKEYSDIPYFENDKGDYKIPAAYLIEKAGFKGGIFGEVKVHEKQPLVLVNLGNAEGNDVLNVAKNIQKTIKEKFNIYLEIEVNVI